MTDQPRRARTELTKEELERLEKYGSIAFQERRGDPEALTEPLQRDRAAYGRAGTLNHLAHGVLPEPAKPTSWTVYRIAAKQIRLGTVEAVDESETIQKAAEEFKQPAAKLYAVRR